VTPALFGVVPFFNDDQPMVNTLCRIIFRLATGKPLSDQESVIVDRIVRKGNEVHHGEATQGPE